MKVFFTASYYGKKKYQRQYSLVLAAIKKFTADVISPEEGNYLDVIDAETRKRLAGNHALLHYEAIRQGIHLSDAVIVEASHEDIQLGHEISMAIMEKKPVLVLSVHEDFSKKIIHEYLFGAKYTERSLPGTIQDFLARVRDLREARRFNMFLYPSQSEYLDRMAKESGMNMSEYIRHLINLDRRTKAGG
jgi:hypothetical protein